MLLIDLAGTPSDKLSEIVAEHCGRFGTVRSTRIHTTETSQRLLYALVKMASTEEAQKVAKSINGSVFNDEVLFNLAQA